MEHGQLLYLFFLPCSARMIDDTKGRSRWVTTMGKRWETESNDGNIEHQTKTKPYRLTQEIGNWRNKHKNVSQLSGVI